MDFLVFNDAAATEIYTLSLRDALPIYQRLSASGVDGQASGRDNAVPVFGAGQHHGTGCGVEFLRDHGADRDRKSTRLNSSHANISYAVFCLKKKNPHLPLFTMKKKSTT